MNALMDRQALMELNASIAKHLLESNACNAIEIFA